MRLDIVRTRVSDVEPLRGMLLETLRAERTKIIDIAPLRGMRLKLLTFDYTAVSDVGPLFDMPILEAAMIPKNASNIEILRRHPTLKYLGWEGDWDEAASRPKLTTAEFWKAYDKKKAANAK